MTPPGEVVIPTPRSIAVDTRGAQIITEDSPATRDSRGIYLPHHIEPVSHIAVDIGGSLAKLVYFTRSPLPPNGLDKAQIASGALAASPPKEDSPFITPSASASYEDPTPLRPNPNGALTPRVLATGDFPPNPLDSHAPGSTAASSSSCSSSQAPPTSYSAAAAAGPSSSVRRSSAHPASAKSSAASKRRSTMPNLPGGLINFTRFETSQIGQCIDFINSLIKQSAAANRVSVDQMKRGVKIIATGGGAHKFYDRFVAELGVAVVQEEEMDCLITGLSFITSIPNEVFWYGDELVYEISHLSYPSPTSTPAPGSPEQAKAAALGHPAPPPNGAPPPPPPAGTKPAPLADLPRPSPDPPKFSVTFAPNPSPEPQFPCLLVNIGSGVSIVKVDKDGSFERVSGTSLGGGTLWGLLSLLTDAESFDEMLSLSEKGDNSHVDMLVGDIYGADYNKIGLKSSTIASSFGKVFQKGPRSSSEGADGAPAGRKRKAAWKQEDLAKSLLYAVSNNIGQIAHMNAEKYDLERIYFGGCFIRGHPATISTLSYAIRFWSKGTKRAMFLRHEGFLGSIGAWIKNVSGDAAAAAAAASSGGLPTPTLGTAQVPDADAVDAALGRVVLDEGAGVRGA